MISKNSLEKFKKTYKRKRKKANKYIYGKAHHDKSTFRLRIYECFNKCRDEIGRVNSSIFGDSRVDSLFFHLRNEMYSLIDRVYQEIKVEQKHNIKIQSSPQKRTFKLPNRLLEGKNCQICGESRAMNICHIIPREEGGTIAEENLIFLCANHHYLFDEAKLSQEEFNKIILEGKAPDAVDYFQKIHRIRHEMFWKYKTNKDRGCNCGSLDFNYIATQNGNEIQPGLQCKNCGEKSTLGINHPLQKFSIKVYEIFEKIPDDEKRRRILEAKKKVERSIQDYLGIKGESTLSNNGKK